MWQSGVILSQGSPLMGQRPLIVPGSGTWVQWAWLNLQGCTGASLGVVDIDAGIGAASGIAGVWFWSHRCCQCNRQRLQELCRLGRCRQCCRNARSGRSLWCGWCDIWGSVSGLNTAFTKVSSRAVVDHAITGVYLVAVFWQDMYHSSRDPELMEGVVHHNGLAGIQGCKRFALFVCLWLGGIGVGINSFMNLEGCQIDVADSVRNGGPNLALVQELSRWWELGINGCSSECQKGELWFSTTVLSTLEFMLHGFYTHLGKSIQLWVVRTGGLICAELSELCTHILRAIVGVEYFRNSMLQEHLFEQWGNFDSVALARWKTLDKDHLWIEVTAYEVVSSFQGKDVHCTHLPWAGWSWCWSEGCCSILALELGVGLTLPNYFFYGFVNAQPEDTSTSKQLCFGGSLMELVE